LMHLHAPVTSHSTRHLHAPMHLPAPVTSQTQLTR
jgi:hypothetical protein